MLGRACTFDCLEEYSNVSAEVHRLFFRIFCQHAAEKFVESCKAYERGDPTTLERIERLYAVNGLPGCVGSTDCVR